MTAQDYFYLDTWTFLDTKPYKKFIGRMVSDSTQ